ncbi:MAG: DSBA oxidoreductase [Candidatus Berkelbacteria bacterium Licking1014_7]|uniref:DSBA oxidoreductase n=1 Tax=Candidatus Berkelbacteria bacterium Licking1014_7 TaxID=2017147 RepID=A0A554LK88_9BACT|nr:MAG: DSBA oxidoreductase [Candidatus Berkelbacteria bacterium Licking1014_7]
MENKSLFGLIVITILVIWGLVAWGSKTSAPSNNAATNNPQIEKITDSDELTIGAQNPQVQIIEYSDVQCSACAIANTALNQIISQNPDTVQLVYRHFPLSYHPFAKPGALGLQAAFRQGKFREMKDALFERQDTLNQEIINQTAQELGLNMEKYRADITDPKLISKIEQNFQKGMTLKITGTPTIYINGAEFKNFADPREIQKKIDEIAGEKR